MRASASTAHGLNLERRWWQLREALTPASGGNMRGLEMIARRFGPAGRRLMVCAWERGGLATFRGVCRLMKVLGRLGARVDAFVLSSPSEPFRIEVRTDRGHFWMPMPPSALACATGWLTLMVRVRLRATTPVRRCRRLAADAPAA